MMDEEPAAMHAIEWASATIKRVCHRSLPAECNRFLTTAESADFLTNMIQEMHNANFTSLNVDPFVDGKKAAIMTDAGRLSSSLEKHGGQPNGKREGS